MGQIVVIRVKSHHRTENSNNNVKISILTAIPKNPIIIIIYLRPTLSPIPLWPTTVDDKSCITLKALNYGNYGIFLIMGNGGFISSTVVTVLFLLLVGLSLPFLVGDSVPFLLLLLGTGVFGSVWGEGFWV